MEESFESVLARFENLIKKLIGSYGLYRDFDEMQQIGRIALWEAYERFDPEKGPFPSYAQKYISGKMLHAVNKACRDQTISCSDSLLLVAGTYEESYLQDIILDESVKCLSKRELLFVECVLLQGERQIDLARREGVSYETVRSWKKSALKKLRRNEQNMDS